MSTPEVTAGDRPMKVLNRSIPNLQLDGLALVLQRAGLEIHIDGADVVFGERVIDAELS